MKKSLPILINLLAGIAMLVTACQPRAIPTVVRSPQAAPTITLPAGSFKLIAIFPGVVTDADYNTLGYMGINEVERELHIETAYEEQVDGAEADDIIRDYIADGYNIIWTHGAQYVAITEDLARHFPEVDFIAEGDEPVPDPPANLWFIDREYQSGFYVIGATAALSTRTGKIGYLGGERLPFTYSEVHAIQQAIRDLDLQGSVELIPVWVGDFNDPTAAKQLAGELISQNVDFIIGSLNLGMFGAFEAVKTVPNRNVLITAKYLDKSSFAPDQYVTSLLYDFKVPLLAIIRSINTGEKSRYYPLDFNSGKSLQLPLRNVSPDVEYRVTSLLEQVINGKIRIQKDTSPIP